MQDQKMAGHRNSVQYSAASVSQGWVNLAMGIFEPTYIPGMVGNCILK